MATAQDTRIDQLTERVERLEADMQKLRVFNADSPSAGLWADMSILRREMQQVRAALNIQHGSVDVIRLQRRLGAKLDRNEFSQSIIDARNE